jgi:hypothetical protein
MVARKTKNQLNLTAGVLLLGGLLFKSGGMSKAAENYFENHGKLIEKVHSLFQDNLGIELQEASEEEKYIMDRKIEEMTCGSSYDRTLESHVEFNNFIERISRNAIKRTLKDSELYKGLKEDISDEVLDLEDISKKAQNLSNIGDSLIERILGRGDVEDSEDKGYKIEANFLNAGYMRTGIHASLSKGEVSGRLTLEDFNLGKLKIEKGEFSGSNKKLKAYLENTIKNDIYKVYAGLNFEMDFDNKETDISLNLSKNEKNEKLTGEIGYHADKKEAGNDGVYARVGYFKKF